MQKWKTWEEKTSTNISKMLRQVERNLEKEDVQVCASRDGAFINGNHESIQLMPEKVTKNIKVKEIWCRFVLKRIKYNLFSRNNRKYLIKSNNGRGPGCSKPDYANLGLARNLISVLYFLVRCFVYIFCHSVLSCSNLKLHQTLEVETLLNKNTQCFR